MVSMLNLQVQVLVIQTLIVSLLLELAQESNHGTSVSLDSELRENSSEHKLIVLWWASSIFLKNCEVGKPLLSFIDFNRLSHSVPIETSILIFHKPLYLHNLGHWGACNM